ncbi:hypothetical protein BGZ61DRAFT_371385 [Ilyonectria robusta]|uniref:uncharacterized protein n=1 Tax=Ilyonectria robusta TaxID=1079257 RepID=UPI001E8E2C81|nr:uncharacterized protein BGZ61DRAFT_371385 [Ilyonectria robusta]KAH8657349.1 hypothetical protein BGZ61DRAFT_371385 [Ilyonectria robusta]
MVFPGHFSTGCKRCRQRKVKCDEAKPTCRRCYVYGKPCPGYTDQFHFRHTLSNPKSKANSSSVSEVATLPQKPASPSPKREGSEEAVDEKSITVAESSRHAIVRNPGISYEQVSLAYFAHRFISQDDGDGFPGHFSFLPDLYDDHNRGLLETATLSVAQMAAYNQFGGDGFRTQSFKNYGRVIRMLRESMQSDDQAIDDKVITTILLLCTHNDISGEGLGDPNEHAPGLFYLLEKRGPGQIGTKRGAELFHLALIRLQIYSFLHEDDTYSDPGAIATIMGLFDPLLRAMSMMSRTLALRHSLSRYMDIETRSNPFHDAPTTSTDEVQQIIKECFEMLENFHIWDEEAAAYWQSTFEARTVPTALGNVIPGKLYYDAETACTIILIRSARLILLMTMLLYHHMMQSVDEGVFGDRLVWAECILVLEQDVTKSIDDILSCVPYALGDIKPSGVSPGNRHDGAGAIVIVHSIRLVSHCAYATPDQLAKAKDILARINSTIGIKSAVGWAQGKDLTSRWAHEQACFSRFATARATSATSSPSTCGTLDHVEINMEYEYMA